MSMRRIWIDPEQIQDAQVGAGYELKDEAFHHAIQVSRLRVGEEFEVVSGGHEALRVRILEIKKKSATVEVVGRRPLPIIKKPYIHLALAMPKWATFEFVLEKSVELGVTSVQPLLSDFSYVRDKRDYSSSKRDRLQKIIRSATEQSGRGPLLNLEEPQSLQEFAGAFNPSGGRAGLFAYEGVSALDVRTELQRLKSPALSEIWLFVGSEGGFSESEVEFMRQKGLPPVTIGEQILRVDTACLALVSVIKYELGLMSS